jgi:hypothetical protein
MRVASVRLKRGCPGVQLSPSPLADLLSRITIINTRRITSFNTLDARHE